MRRKDREITDLETILQIIDECDVCRIAINNEDFPYIVPLNFGYDTSNGVIELYFHSALKGTKLDLIRKDNRVSFEMDCCHEIVSNEKNKNCSMNYKSVIGNGHIEFVTDSQKINALKKILSHYHKDDFPIDERVLSVTQVYKLIVKDITAKQRRGDA